MALITKSKTPQSFSPSHWPESLLQDAKQAEPRHYSMLIQALCLQGRGPGRVAVPWYGPRADRGFLLQTDNGGSSADWIYKNQLGRRNLSPDAFKLLLGRRYNRTKKALGGQIPGSRVAQIDPPLFTAERLATEHSVSPATVKRAGKFAEEVEKTPELKKAIETGRRCYRHRGATWQGGLFIPALL